MAGDDWPDDSRERDYEPDARREDQDAWYDRPGEGPPPPPKKGMSTATKVLLIMLCVFGGFCLLCCGGIVYIASQMDFDFNDDPAVAKQRLAEMADIDVPDSFEAEGSLSFDIFFMSMKMVVFNPTEGEGALGISQVNLEIEAGPEAEEDMRRSIRQQGHQRDLRVNQETIEMREFEIRGETVEFEFAQAENDQGEAFRQVTGSFPAKEGTAILILQIDEEHYDEEAIVQMLESIK